MIDWSKRTVAPLGPTPDGFSTLLNQIVFPALIGEPLKLALIELLCTQLASVVVVVGAAVVDVVVVVVLVVEDGVTHVPLESQVPPTPHGAPALGVTLQEGVLLHVRVLHSSLPQVIEVPTHTPFPLQVSL